MANLTIDFTDILQSDKNDEARVISLRREKAKEA